MVLGRIRVEPLHTRQMNLTDAIEPLTVEEANMLFPGVGLTSEEAMYDGIKNLGLTSGGQLVMTAFSSVWYWDTGRKGWYSRDKSSGLVQW